MKNILTLAAALFAYTASFSQDAPETDTKTFSIGPSVGFGHTGISHMTGVDQFKPYWSGGLILTYSTSEHIGFAADILWSLEGANVERDNLENDLTLQYIRVPLKFAYFFRDFTDDFRPKVTIGPSMGFLLDAENYVQGDGTSDVTSLYEKFDIGANASVGFNWRLRTHWWMNMELNYYKGFTAIRADQYNTNVGLKIGLAFGL